MTVKDIERVHHHCEGLLFNKRMLMNFLLPANRTVLGGAPAKSFEHHTGKADADVTLPTYVLTLRSNPDQ
jgi:hypothetical protein